jgi:5'-nucleotidase
MRILVTNDDGFDSPGLHTLAKALKPFGEVVVAAPDREYSGASSSVGPIPLTTEKHKVEIDGIDEAWAVSGPPGLIVFLASMGGFGIPFDLVVSGINPGANVGNPVYLSGTIGAAILARMNGITGIAISQESVNSLVEKFSAHETSEQKWETAAQIAAIVVSNLQETPLPEPSVLNINVPNAEISQIKGWVRAEIGDTFATQRSVTIEPSQGEKDSYKLIMGNGERISHLPIEIDTGAVANGYVSVTWVSKLSLEEAPFGESVEASLDAHFRKGN